MMVFVCGGLSLFCPMVQSAGAETLLHASSTDHTMDTGCQDSLGSSTTQTVDAYLCARQTVAISLDHNLPALNVNSGVSFAPSDPPRHLLLCTLLI